MPDGLTELALLIVYGIASGFIGWFRQRFKVKAVEAELSTTKKEYEATLSEQEMALKLKEREADVVNTTAVIDMLNTVMNRLNANMDRFANVAEQQADTLRVYVDGLADRTRKIESLESGTASGFTTVKELLNQQDILRAKATDRILDNTMEEHVQTRKYLIDEWRPVIEFADRFIEAFSRDKRVRLRGLMEAFLSDVYEVANGELQTKAQTETRESTEDPEKPAPDAMPAATAGRPTSAEGKEGNPEGSLPG